ncbi:MAG: HAD family hydrolase [Bacilli bacterium]|nr:HAD family hydrolase [Bacilli bacterium]
MEKKNIDLNAIKVVIFDFDDTLAIHKNRDYVKQRNENKETLLNYYYNGYLNPDTFYDIIEPCSISKKLQKLVDICEKQGIKMYCVSGMHFSFLLRAKENYLHKYYSENIEIISARTQELKCDAIRIIQRINNCKLNEIIFIDDIKDNIIMFNNMGIQGFLPEEIQL